MTSSILITFMQVLPPLVVISILIFACFIFYKQYVVKAKALTKTLGWIRGAVISMRDGEPATRIPGLTKVFMGTALEENWNDFVRNLHEQTTVSSAGRIEKRHRLILPSDHFFTAASVLDKPLAVNYFKHLPGILTGIGIIGTFAGLLFGLSHFDASSPKAINSSVTLLLGGVRDAFYASAFAITAAMVVTHIEKLFYQRCLSSLEDLNEAINRMFELGVHEEYLSRIAEGLLEPSEMFQKIGEELSTEIANMSHSMSKMQTEMVKVLEGALGQVMVSANNRLAKQFETALQRQLAAPLESINLRLGSQLAKRPDSNAENIRKIVKAQTQSQAAGEVA